MRYSSKRLVEEMCVDEPYALEASGNLEDLEQVTATSFICLLSKSIRAR